MKRTNQRRENEESQISEADYIIHAAEVCIMDLTGFLSHIRGISEKLGTHIICLNADIIAGRAHAELAIKLAARSFFRDKEPISNSFEMEVLLYAGGTRQCADAGHFGIHEGINRIYICIYPKNNEAIELLKQYVKFTKNDVNQLEEEKYNRLVSQFEISDEELQVVGHDHLFDLVLERVALLDVNK